MPHNDRPLLRSLRPWHLPLFFLAFTGCGGGSGPAGDGDPATGGGTWTVTATAGPGGSISPAGATVSEGESASFTVIPDGDYAVASVTGCNGSLAGDTYTTGPVSADCTVTASFTARTTGVTWTVTATADPAAGGSVTGSGTFAEGETVTLTATPGDGYRFVNWTEDGEPVASTTSYAFTASADRSLVAHFALLAAEDETTPYDIAAFGYEDLRPATFNPLRRRRAPLVKSEELLVLPVGMPSFLEDDHEDQNPTINLASRPGFPGAAAYYRSAGRADVDGDGREELVILRLGDPDDDPVAGLVLGIYTLGPGDEPLLQATIADGAPMLTARMAPADVDGDGADELVIYGVVGPDAQHIAYSRFAVYDFNGTDYDKLFDLGADYSDLKEIAVAPGDFDGNGRDELLVVWRTDTVLWSGKRVTAISANIFTPTPRANGFTVTTVTDLSPDLMQDGDYQVLELGAAAADVDGDGRPEPVVATIRLDTSTGTPEIDVLALKLRGGRLTPMASAKQGLQTTDHSPYDDELWLLATADLNGDGQEEIVSTLRDLDGGTAQWGCRFSHFALNNAAVEKGFDATVSTVMLRSSDASRKSRCAMAVLDNDRDSEDEVALGRLDPGDPDPLGTVYNVLWRQEITAVTTPQDLYTLIGEELPAQTTGLTHRNPSPITFVGADFDGDNLEVKYTGKKWLSLPNPMVMYVAAAPPNQGNVSHNFVDTGTAVTFIDYTEDSKGSGLGVTTGVTLSMETPDFFDIFVSLQASGGISRTFKQTQTNTRIVTRETSFAGPPDADKVAFQGTLFMSYEYEVVGAPKDADGTSDLIGTRITIDEPVATKIWHWPLDFFNATVDASQRIGPDIMDHTPGMVSSYMRESDKNAFKNSSDFIMEMGPITVNYSGGSLGGGYGSLSIETTDENLTEVEISKTVDYSTGMSVAGIGMSVSRSIEDTGIYSVTLGKGVRYEGKVGEILSLEEYQEYYYDWGMFVRWAERTDGAKFQVIDYWVDNLGPGYKN